MYVGKEDFMLGEEDFMLMYVEEHFGCWFMLQSTLLLVNVRKHFGGVDVCWREEHFLLLYVGEEHFLLI